MHEASAPIQVDNEKLYKFSWTIRIFCVSTLAVPEGAIVSLCITEKRQQRQVRSCIGSATHLIMEEGNNMILSWKQLYNGMKETYHLPRQSSKYTCTWTDHEGAMMSLFRDNAKSFEQWCLYA